MAGQQSVEQSIELHEETYVVSSQRDKIEDAPVIDRLWDTVYGAKSISYFTMSKLQQKEPVIAAQDTVIAEDIEYAKGEQSEFDNYILYTSETGLGFVFHLKNGIYITDKLELDEDKYRCAKINDGGLIILDYVYLTKTQLNNVSALKGLDLLRKQAAYNDQRIEFDQLTELKLSVSTVDTVKAELILLKESKMNWNFFINYPSSREQVVYYVSDIESVDKFVCRLSNKNSEDILNTEIAYPQMIILNHNEIKELEINAFDGTGYKVSFDKDIYSLYASFYFSAKHKPSCALLMAVIVTFFAQFFSVAALMWSFDVEYTEDVIKNFTIYAFQQCGFTTDTEETPFCLNLDTSNTSYAGVDPPLSLVEEDGFTQEFVIEQPFYFVLGYVATAFTSLLVLTFLMYKNVEPPIKLYASLNCCDTMDKWDVIKVKCICYLIMLMVLFTNGVSVWSIVTYSVGNGISNSFGLIKLGIVVKFVLQVDEWVYHFVSIFYTQYIKNSYGVEVTKNALPDFGKRGKNIMTVFICTQALACYIALLGAAWFMDNYIGAISDDVLQISNQIAVGTAAFYTIIIIAVLLSRNRYIKSMCCH